MKNSKSLLNMTVTAVFLAIIIIMSFTPLGYLKTAGIEISLLPIPVAAGAAILGVGGGAFLGLAFGVTSFIQCFGMSAFGTTIMGINPVLTCILCVVPRILVGTFSGLIFTAMKKKNINPNVSSLVSFLATAVLNTLFFVGLFILFFSKTQFFSDMQTSFEATNLIAFFAAFVGVNGIVEAVASGVVGAALGGVLARLNKQMKTAAK